MSELCLGILFILGTIYVLAHYDLGNCLSEGIKQVAKHWRFLFWYVLIALTVTSISVALMSLMP